MKEHVISNIMVPLVCSWHLPNSSYCQSKDSTKIDKNPQWWIKG